MIHPVDERLASLGVTLPDAPTPAANYLPYILSGNQLLIAGQAAVVGGKHAFVGRLGAELSVAAGRQAARVAEGRPPRRLGNGRSRSCRMVGDSD